MIKIKNILSLIFISIALILGIYFFLRLEFPVGIDAYFNRAYYQQFGPLAISVELLIAGIYLFINHAEVNFTLALYGFTALLDPLFNALGFFDNNMPMVATLIFVGCGLIAIWIAFTNAFHTKRISTLRAVGSFILGSAIEIFFNGL